MTAEQVKKLIEEMLADYFGESELIEHAAGTAHSRYQLVCDSQINSIAFGSSLREMYYKAKQAVRWGWRRHCGMNPEKAAGELPPDFGICRGPTR